MLAAARFNIELESLHPLTLKACITGKARASKAEMMRFLRHLLPGLDPKMPDDTADAIALALAASLLGAKNKFVAAG